jgi:hypothetical protein
MLQFEFRIQNSGARIIINLIFFKNRYSGFWILTPVFFLMLEF